MAMYAEFNLPLSLLLWSSHSGEY